jgi:hypothetical protein
MTPVPFAKTPVRLALDPSVTIVGLAVKLVMEGGFPPPPLLLPPHPASVTIPSEKTAAIAAATKLLCLMASSNQS